jgi:creatinine amidohydrolase
MIENPNTTSAGIPAGMSATPQTVAILPLGATEQHGPHLPPETDWIIAQSLADRLQQALPSNTETVFLPVEKIGYSPEHLDFPGTQSLEYDEAVNRWTGIGGHLARNNLRKLLLLNAHGGNSPLLSIVATELRCRHNMLCVATSWTRFGLPEGIFDQSEIAAGIHGGAVETSIMLALRPDLVDCDAMMNFSNFQTELIKQNVFLRAYGPHSFGWKIQDLNSKGVVGNAKLANAGKGEAILDHCVAGLVRLVAEMAQFDLAHFESSI